MSEQAIRSRRGQRLAAGMAATSLMSLGLFVAPAMADATVGPDLSVTWIKIVNGPVVAGKQIHFDAGVQNTGGEGTGVFNIKWFVDGQEVGAYGSHEGVPAGSSKLDGNSQFYHTFGDPGSRHNVTFIVDVDNHVAEIAEGNNRYNTSFLVR
jgi:subtilase family serine protease